jgi:ABC-type Zn uptake system ZnuABC Zn-binding protein ZnuA
MSSTRSCVAITLTALALTACTSGIGPSSDSSGVPDDGRLRVATTVAPITSIVAAVGGDMIDITGIVPEGTNSHTFEPAPSVAELLSTVDMFVLNGLQLEEPTRELADANLRPDATIVSLGDLVLEPGDEIYDFSFPEAEGKPNPHLWTDPTLVIAYTDAVAAALTSADPDNAAAFETNRSAYVAEVERFEAAMVIALDTVTASDRRLLTYHDSFAYFARSYGWDVIGAVQVSDFGEPTAKEVADLITQVRDAGIPAIFGSEVFPSPVLEQIGQEAGVSYVDVLRDDDLPGEPGDVDHSLLGLLRFDFRTIVEALGGDPSALDALDLTPTALDNASYPQ